MVPDAHSIHSFTTVGSKGFVFDLHDRLSHLGIEQIDQARDEEGCGQRHDALREDARGLMALVLGKGRRKNHKQDQRAGTWILNSMLYQRRGQDRRTG